jgi:hypothetical protein
MVVLFVVVAGVAAAAGVVLAGTLIVNNGFNGAFHPQTGVNGTVPDGWSAINLAGNPIWTDSNSFAGGEKTEGSNAAVIVSEHIEDCCDGNRDGWPFDAVLYQQVHGVVSGTVYSFATAMLTFCGGTAEVSACWHTNNYTISKMVGIDPTGGISPTANSVIWSAPNGDDHAWRDMTVAARARSTTITVFIRVRWPYTFHGAFAVYDAAYLALAPVGSISANSATSTGPMTINWSAQVPQDVSDYYQGIQLAYDVEMRDGTSGPWTKLLTGTQDTHLNYNGVTGHTYQFRLLPFLGYPPDNHRLEGLYSGPVTVTVADLLPPVSAVAPLPAVQLSPAFAVHWSGSDNVSPVSALTYDVQYRDGPAGQWTNWQNNTTATTATFAGQAGHHYDFRSRAHDEANNVEAYPSLPDASTAVALAVDGSVQNMRGLPVALASVNFSPPGLAFAATQPDGTYVAYVMAGGDYTMQAARAEFGVLPAITVVVTANGATAPDAYLPPANDLIANGQFESGNFGGWTLSGENSPTLSTQPHSGGHAAALGGTAGVESSLKQTLLLAPGMHLATLSYLLRAPLVGTDRFTVTVSGDQLISVTTPAITSGWTHQWLDLTPFAGQKLTVSFAFLPGSASSQLLIDEVEVGPADSVAIHETFLPLITR